MVWVVYTLAQVSVTLRHTELLEFVDDRRACQFDLLVDHIQGVIHVYQIVPIERNFLEILVELIDKLYVTVAGLYNYPAEASLRGWVSEPTYQFGNRRETVEGIGTSEGCEHVAYDKL